MKLLRFFTCFLILVVGLSPVRVSAQTDDERVIEFFSTNATMEDDPNKQDYTITIFSPDGEWKMQLNYKSPSMFGTFGNKEFNLSGNGSNFNFVRNPKNDMVFYAFSDMNVTVSNEGNLYRVKANCLTTNKIRFLVEATIDAPQATETRTDDLGYARVEENPFYGTFAIYAENENYRLAYGVAGTSLLGNFYRADMLMPELYDKKAGKSINMLNATAVHTQEGDNTIMKVELLGENLVMYNLTMFNGPYDIATTQEIDVKISGATLEDVSDMYGCFIIYGGNALYQMGIALRPEALESGRLEFTRNDLIMQYTRLHFLEDDSDAEIFDINVTLEEGGKAIIVKADVKCMDGTLYHITMYLEEEGFMPEPSKTVDIDFGHVTVLDYTEGMGVVGIGAVVPEKYQIRVYLNTPKLEGEFTTADFNLELCDVMVVSEDSYAFHDAQYVNASMVKEDGRTYITIDLYGMDDVLYHATMYVDDLKCLQEECTYQISYDDEITMMALRQGNDKYGEYTMQFQALDNVFDEDYNIIGDGYFFSFYFAHDGYGVSGNYGYSDGTLADDEPHCFYENGCEVRVAPVAGTLNVTPVKSIRLDLGFPIGIVNTYLYNTSFQFLGQNGSIYRGEGENFLLCINDEGEILKIDENKANSIGETLAKQGMRVRKVLRNGKIVIEHQDAEYDMSGKLLKLAR